jgi:hypothetical protein
MLCILCRQNACDLKSYLKAIVRQWWGNQKSSYICYQQKFHPSKLQKCGFLLPAHAQALELLESLSEPHSDTLLLVLLGA